MDFYTTPSSNQKVSEFMKKNNHKENKKCKKYTDKNGHKIL